MRNRSKLAVTAVCAVAALATAVPLTYAGASAKTSTSNANIVQTAVAAGKFKTLVTLVKKAGLVGALSGKGPLTVFAPTDAVFAKLPKSTLTALAGNKSKLRAVLLYHVVAGRLTATKVAAAHSLETLNGQSLTVHASHGTVTVGGAKVIAANVPASNGVIHVIDKVLVPAG